MLRNRLRVRLLGTVPISIAVHLVAIVFLVIIPVVADVTPPLPNEVTPSFVRAAAVPPAPGVLHPAHAARAPLAARTTPAPTTAPPTIVREPVVPDVPASDVQSGIPGTDGAPFGTAVSAGAPPSRPPAPPPPAGPVRAAQLPMPPVRIADALPVYPEIARAVHVGGTVILECVIDTTGHVTNVRVVKSVPLLDRAAIEAVRQWRYTPSVYNGRPVSVLMTVTVRFVLR